MKNKKIKKYTRDKNAVFHTEEDRLFILDASQQHIVSLNKTGGILWEALSQPRSLLELKQVLEDTFEVSPSVAREDVGKFLNQMKKLTLVK